MSAVLYELRYDPGEHWSTVNVEDISKLRVPSVTVNPRTLEPANAKGAM